MCTPHTSCKQNVCTFCKHSSYVFDCPIVELGLYTNELGRHNFFIYFVVGQSVLWPYRLQNIQLNIPSSKTWLSYKNTYNFSKKKSTKQNLKLKITFTKYGNVLIQSKTKITLN